MADQQETTPAPDHPHDVPSSPRSPHPKRMKKEEPVNLSVASMLNDAAPLATPTPDTAPLANPLASTALPTMAAAPQQPQTLPSMTMPSFSAPMPARPTLQVRLLSPTAKAPTRGSAHAAGYDLYASVANTIPARGRTLVDTDISIAVPADTYGRVAPRSGLAVKHGIDVGAGVIDADYRGQVKVLLFNLTDSEFKVEVGERIAQIIMEKVCPCDCIDFDGYTGLCGRDVVLRVDVRLEVLDYERGKADTLPDKIVSADIEVVAELPETVRGAGGFGSTGGFGGQLAPMAVQAAAVDGLATSTLPGAPGGG